MRCVVVGSDFSGLTLLAWLRKQSPELSWSACRKLLASRRVMVNGVLEIHEARRLKAGDAVAIAAAGTSPPSARHIPLIDVDQDVVVVEKPPHIVTTRRPEEQRWPADKRALAPTLDELVAEALQLRERSAHPQPLFRVQRLDRETSGLVVFARTKAAADGLIAQFTARTVERVYLACVNGRPEPQTITSHLVRNRGDGLRGSSPDGKSGQLAVTHVWILRQRRDISVVECRLETGRTHQIRIHLCEQGTPVCGERVYTHRLGATAIPDASAAPRLALHAARLGFRHPLTGQSLSFASPWPPDLARWMPFV